ncbi:MULTISPECIES: hypothetical protein [unclassified Meiothermus]|uniref:hypothetical protein n=1 Tax=unclassified Meiothermus TaxID=370471 RepID=UPI000D7CAFDF|nr:MULTISPECIES: hypothetical protein [unclassified Meiothermus]PZA06223.1 hypothetical protein DNA98_14780 [Meiothermus sp. Pnk-1]RYM37443.1 hypothetical protein EWH23_05945 [Meiothermus sp. PNK-Is4]
MPLKFGRLGVATKTYYVQKTGFPFYDACQLVGAMHLFFGSGASSLRDLRTHWELSGPVAGANPANYGERLKGKGLERVEQTTLAVLDELEASRGDIESFFEARPPKAEVLQRARQEGVSRYLEPAWQMGARSPDAAQHGVLASQRGLPSKRPVPEILVATLGLTQAALAYGNDEVTTVLPVLENSVQPMTPFITFKQRYQHQAGGAVSAVFAAVGILADLGLRYRIQDFAFAYHGGRGFYYSGLLGLHRLCAAFAGVKKFAHEALDYLERTRSLEKGVPLDLARLLADFLKNPSPDTLAAMARAKARVLVDESLPVNVRAAASGLLGTPVSIQEAMRMAEIRQIPPPSEALVKALGEVFRGEGNGDWIGAYIGLERADKPEKFYAEVAKILSRALAKAEKERKWLAKNLKEAMDSLSSEEVLSAYDQRTFPAHKTAFLLRVLASMKYQSAKLEAVEAAQGEEA